MSHKKSMGSLHLCGIGDFEPGDLPPEGYLEWHAWADVQHKSGLRQTQCSECKLWRYPQQMYNKAICTKCVDEAKKVIL